MNIPEISVEVLESWLQEQKEFVLLDVREADELELCNFGEKTLNIPIGRLHLMFDTLPENKPIVVVCRSGVRSAYATRFLQEEGFDRTCNLKGGILEYIRFFDKDWKTY